MSSQKMNRPFIPTATAPACWCFIGVRTGGCPVKSPSHERRRTSVKIHSDSFSPGAQVSPGRPSQVGSPGNRKASCVHAAQESGSAYTSG
jgi:hypothetical protein